MRKSGLYVTVVAVSMFTLLVLAACGPASAVNATTGSTPYQDETGPQLAADEISSTPTDQLVAVDEPSTGPNNVGQDVAMQAVDAATNEVALVQVDDAALNEIEDVASNQQVSLFNVEPIVASCCGPLGMASK